MTALAMVQGLFGSNGYRVYSEALGRQSTRFHASISDSTTVTSRLVTLACELMAEAKVYGCCPRELLTQDLKKPVLSCEGGVEMCLNFAFGTNATDMLSYRLSMSRKAVEHAICTTDARYQPHFRLIAAVGLAIKSAAGMQTVRLPGSQEKLAA